jgi:hypothetical protein
MACQKVLEGLPDGLSKGMRKPKNRTTWSGKVQDN